jgi:hypothetical protein
MKITKLTGIIALLSSSCAAILAAVPVSVVAGPAVVAAAALLGNIPVLACNPRLLVAEAVLSWSFPLPLSIGCANNLSGKDGY